MITLIPAFLAGWLVCLALLIIFHLLWRHAHRIVRYMLGAGAICMGCTIAGAVLDDPVLTFGPWTIGSAGLLIALWTWLEDRTAEHTRKAQQRGEITGMARGILTQDAIDRGGRNAQRPGHDRQN